ncbi:hypothetical protein GQ44DRAFT_259671 [Phaeosphaeriaceae sp. PMI808]|nr:hypothetical protein GQ44DRAFT_259671 [Phaeosphaeriaceae sp. PMI808]
MNPSPSPPQEAEHIRHQQLTPESPRPQNVPSPANIPILELQMDPDFHESSLNNGNGNGSAHSHSHSHSHLHSHSHTHTPTLNAAAASSSSSSTPFFAETATTANYQIIGAQGMGGGGPGTYAQNTPPSIHTFSAHQPARAASEYTFAHETAYKVAQSAQGAHYQIEGNPTATATAPATATATATPTSVDVQALLDSLTPAAHNPHMSPLSATLPARPPAQDHPVTHPNYSPTDDIRSFHPHSQQPPNTQQRAANPALQPLTQQRQPAQRSETPDDEDIRWPPETNKKYEEFLDQERKFVTEGQWDQFPVGSRLFIGNLPTEKVTKRDIFHRFHRHGRLAQISIKQAYGFVQFLGSDSCRKALDAEQGQAVRGRKMHLEISKPQKNSRKAEPQNSGVRRRSRSPDYTRGGTAPTQRDSRYANNTGPLSPREWDRRFRDRDDYRPMRSPSPRGVPRGMRSRDRSRDRFDTRYRSRSRSPPRRRRSPSPRQDYTEDDLDLRRRLPHEVPDIQILVLNEGISRDFIRFVEDNVFRQQGLRSNVLIMSGRFPEPAVVRRQIIEGVLAIVRMDTSGFIKGKVSVQIFDRRGGVNNVQFNEYADLDPTTAALLVNNAKQTQSQPVQPPAPAFAFNRNMPSFNQQPSLPFPSAPPNQPNISNLITSLDSASLSQLLASMSGNNVAQNSQPAPNFSADLARLLAQVSSPAQTPGYGPQTQAQLPQLGHLASLLANQAHTAAPPVQNTTQASASPDMSEIMAQLAQYQR